MSLLRKILGVFIEKRKKVRGGFGHFDGRRW